MQKPTISRRTRTAWTGVALCLILGISWGYTAPAFSHEPHATEDAAPDEGTSAAAESAKVVPHGPYPLETCVVAGSKLGSMGDPHVIEHQGREVKFCCAGCMGAFERDPAQYHAKLDAAVIEQQLPTYPLQTCVVLEDQKLDGSHGKVVNHVYRNHLVRFCCAMCVKQFESDPALYIGKIQAARATQERQRESEE